MVTKKPKGLGRGLEALLGPKVDETRAETAALHEAREGQATGSLALDELVPGMYQPRTRMDEGALYELAESIKAQGIMSPILVRKLADGPNAGKHEIIAGERRFRAARLAGLDRVPVLVRDVPNEAAAAMALIENIQREDLNPLEEAQGLQRLIREFGLTHEQAAQAVGRSRSAASNLLRLLNLAEPVQGMLMAGDIDMGHARALLALDRATQITAANQITAKKMSVREAESRVRFLGYSPTAAKLFAFVLSALLAGIAGALYVPQVGIINPGEFSPANSIEVAIWVAVGGRGTLYGAILGGVVINLVKTWLTGAAPELWLFVLGGLFIASTLLFPKGIVGMVGQWKAWRDEKRAFAQNELNLGDKPTAGEKGAE
ncbi:MAG: ParB/RepB/Spo0J family partition protein [Ferrovibrio sp.]